MSKPSKVSFSSPELQAAWDKVFGGNPPKSSEPLKLAEAFDNAMLELPTNSEAMQCCDEADAALDDLEKALVALRRFL